MSFKTSFLIFDHHLQDLPDVQELIAEVNAEKYSLQAAAILGESIFFESSLVYLNRRFDSFISAWLFLQS